MALNVASVPGDESLLDGIAGTLRHEFESVAVWPALRFNQILLGFDAPPRSAFRSRSTETAPLAELLGRDPEPVTEKADRPWTDDRAPVEW